MSVMDASEETPRGKKILLLALYGPAVTGLLNNVCSILGVLLQAPRGMTIRPMGLALWIAVIGLVSAVAGILIGAVVIVRCRRQPVIWLNALVAIALSLSPYPIGVWLFRWVASSRGLILAD
jgi:hypothetical protein